MFFREFSEFLRQPFFLRTLLKGCFWKKNSAAKPYRVIEQSPFSTNFSISQSWYLDYVMYFYKLRKRLSHPYFRNTYPIMPTPTLSNFVPSPSPNLLVALFLLLNGWSSTIWCVIFRLMTLLIYTCQALFCF